MDDLQEFGLTQRESKVYLALLELGSTTTGPLIKQSKVPNSKIYEILKSLEDKGLAGWIIKGKIKHFQASDPDQLLSLLKNKEIRLKQLLPQLKIKKKKEKEKYVRLFEGMKAIRSMFLGLVQDVTKGENFYGFSTGKSSSNKEIEEFYEWWGALKLNVGLSDHLLVSLKNKNLFLKSLSKEARVVLKNHLKFSNISFPGDTAIFRNHILILNWDDIPTATLITNKNLAKEYKDFFLGIWQNSSH